MATIISIRKAPNQMSTGIEALVSRDGIETWVDEIHFDAEGISCAVANYEAERVKSALRKRKRPQAQPVRTGGRAETLVECMKRPHRAPLVRISSATH